MSDSEEDYMSDAFLAKCQDNRPGLIKGRAVREHKQYKKIKEKNAKHKTKPQRVLEQEKRDEGLSTAIGQDNKGFNLLQKMGYKPGMAIGKKGDGRSEPIPINFRSGRGGLGEDTHRKRKQSEMAAMRAAIAAKRQKNYAMSQQDYREQKRREAMEKLAAKDLYKSQRVCEQLDEEQGYNEPIEKYFWTEAKLDLVFKKKESDEEDEEDAGDEDNYFHIQKDSSEQKASEESEEEDECTLTPLEQLEMLTAYLRDTYLYCVWCGTRFDDEEDLKQNCPGNTSEDHDS